MIMINWHVLPTETETVYPPESAPPGSVSILKPDGTYVDVHVNDYVGGQWVENPQKVAARQAEQQAQAQAAAVQAARLAKIKGPLTEVNSVAELKAAFKDLVTELVAKGIL